MKSNAKKNKQAALDFLYVIGSVIVLMPLFYAISSLKPSLPVTIVYILLLYPTLRALINGAPFVPTPMTAVNKMIKAANLKPGQIVYDIGCGDGRIVHIASKNHNVKATGFELSPFVYLLARIRKFFWRSKAKIKFSDFKKHNLSDADVIFCYLLPDTLAKLYPKLAQELKPGTRVVSYAFPIAQWKEEEKLPPERDINLGPVWIYRQK